MEVVIGLIVVGAILYGIWWMRRRSDAGESVWVGGGATTADENEEPERDEE